MRRWPAFLLLLVMGLVGPVYTWADDKKPVNVEVWVIRATTKNKEISKELKSLAETLKKQFKYTGFKLEKRIAKRVELGKSFKADLIGGYKLTLTAKARLSKRVQLQLAVSKRVGKKDKTVLNTTVTIKAGPLLPVGGLPLKGGDKLILAVRAR